MVERAVVLATGPEVDIQDFPTRKAAHSEGDLGTLVPGLRMSEIERIAILQTLDATGGSTAKAAKMLGISRRTIQYRLKEWGQAGRSPSSS